jgi:cell cycle sensor histidine kinase DivJ
MSWLENLTHESVMARPFERARHKSFMAARLAVAACLLLAAPFWLALVQAPTLVQGSLFAFSLAPLIAVAVLSRTGGLRHAQNISIAGWLTLAVAIHAVAPAYDAVSVLLFAIALVEAALTIDALTVAAVVASATGLLALDALLHMLGAAPLTLERPANVAMFAAPLMLYIALLSINAISAEQSRAGADKQNARDLRLLTGAIGDIVLHLDRTAAVSSIAGDTHKTYGLDRRDLIGRGFFQRVHVADRPAFLKLVSDAIATEAPANAVLRVQVGSEPNPSGRYIEPVFNYFDARTCHVGARNGKEDAASAPVVCILRDVTAAKRAEEEIAAAREESERATASKTRFLANVSHELRTPLNAIIGFSEMLANEDLAPAGPAKRKEYAEIISGSGHHLLEVVNTILDMSKIEAGSMQLCPEPFSLPMLADQCCDMMQLKAEQTGVTLARDYGGDLEEIVADRRACKQIIINLLSNAVKFTPASGRVAIRLRPDGNFLAISVADSGIGISAGDFARLGDPFFQASASHDRAYEGTGLGLSVVRGLVGLHGGSITIESAPKCGATVTVRLPLDTRNQVPASALAKIETIARHGAAPRGHGMGHELGHELGHEQQAVKKIA